MADLDVEMELDLTFDADVPVDQQSPPPAPVQDQQDNGDEETQPNKVVITGLNEMHPTHVKNYVRHYFGELKSIEWINDTSANLVFDTPEQASEALRAMSGVQVDNPRDLRTAQPHPDAEFSKYDLSVRQSLVTDVKKRGAHLESRFYLLHPEYDPENRKRQDSRRGRDDRRRPRRDYGGPQGVEPKIFLDYDEKSDDNRDSTGYDRLRSASPSRESNGRYRSRSPRRNRDKPTRDLFENIVAKRSTLRDSPVDRPRSTEPRAAPIELFPLKALNGAALSPFHDSPRPAGRDLMSRISNGGDLMSRINKAPATNHGRLSSDDNYTFRGASNNYDNDFSFRGASDKKARELFPDKVRKSSGRDDGGKPKDLMDGIVKSRRRAEDYDY